MTARGPGAAGQIKRLEVMLDDTWKIVDYWKVRALRAEGHDIPERPFPASALTRSTDSDPTDSGANPSDRSRPIGAVQSATDTASPHHAKEQP